MSFEADRFETVGFLDDLRRCHLWGFDLDRLCSFVRFENGEAEDPYGRFVTLVMDSKLPLPEKDCTDVLEIDADEERPYGVDTLFAQFALLGANNRKVDRYVPIDQIRSALRAGIGERCPVDEIIDAYLEQEAATGVVRLTGGESSGEIDRAAAIDASQALNDVMNARMRAQNELRETYDIARSVLLPSYGAGDSISPKVERSACDHLNSYRGVTSEDTYRTLMGEGPRERCAWLAYQNRYITLRDKDWEKIFDDIMAHPESFARYYPMARVVANTRPSKPPSGPS